MRPLYDSVETLPVDFQWNAFGNPYPGYTVNIGYNFQIADNPDFQSAFDTTVGLNSLSSAGNALGEHLRPGDRPGRAYWWRTRPMISPFGFVPIDSNLWEQQGAWWFRRTFDSTNRFQLVRYEQVPGGGDPGNGGGTRNGGTGGTVGTGTLITQGGVTGIPAPAPTPAPIDTKTLVLIGAGILAIILLTR